jgi:hypothetical protein
MSRHSRPMPRPQPWKATWPPPTASRKPTYPRDSPSRRPRGDERRVGAVRLWGPVRDVARLAASGKRDPEQMLDLEDECHGAWSASPPSPSSASA